jgi:hypothetical protein
VQDGSASDHDGAVAGGARVGIDRAARQMELGRNPQQGISGFGSGIMTEKAAMIDLVPVPVTGVKAETIDGELLLYHPRQTKAIYLNPSAAGIWSLCDGQRRVGEIIEMIGESYPEAKDNLQEEVFATLQRLRDDGVLRTTG